MKEQTRLLIYIILCTGIILSLITFAGLFFLCADETSRENGDIVFSTRLVITSLFLVLMGLVTGVYCANFIAAPLWIAWRESKMPPSDKEVIVPGTCAIIPSAGGGDEV